MRLAISLAKLGEGRVNPNPLVGAVIVKDGYIVGMGFHEKYGELHAERNAIKSVYEGINPIIYEKIDLNGFRLNLQQEDSLKGADIYVTLEPCSHYGHQPPCALALIENGFKNVYVGSRDPNPLVSGRGNKMLRDAGINVFTDVLRDECDEINRVFFHFITTNEPYVVMKYAQTMDGKIACYTGESKYVTGEIARNHVQKLRNRLSGIMVGVGTVLKDNPALTCRIEGGRDPVRIICDSRLRTPLDSYIVESAKEVETIIAVSEKYIDSSDLVNSDLVQKFRDKGVEILILPASGMADGRVSLKALMTTLGERKIDGILLEGGGTLNASALEEGIVSEVDVYMAPKIFGGESAPSPVRGEGVKTPAECYSFERIGIETFGEDVLLRYVVKK